MTNKLIRLSKTILNISNNAQKFLNGITSNDLNKPRNAFLDFHGKIICVFDQQQIKDDQFLVVIEDRFLDLLMQHLERYIRLSRAQVAKAPFQAYFDLTGDYPIKDGEYTIAQKKGQLVISPQVLAETVSREELTLFRLKNNIPVHGIDFSDEMILNVSAEEFVSFTKGCFLGQEFVAKVNSRSRPSWKLVVRAESELDGSERQVMTSKTFDPETKKTFGFVFVPNR